ncbi:hypothetical protein GE061_005646 [Apolygus lucorum]|uniref:Uncharacterized protein n=1 Tax=Apolygus lucorum TaxID=248454 RepID=A0A8S9WY93_APOLU|nr:hypothetical protein GE061_005646 [Apolygus lucorum]
MTANTVKELVQGITLCVLSLLGFFSYTCYLQVSVPANPDELTFKHYLAAYFQGNSCQPELLKLYPELDQVTSSQKLLLLNVFIFAFNFFLCFASAMLMFALWTEKTHLAFGWTLFYLMMCYSVAFVDLVAVSLISLDYGVVSYASQLQGRSLAMLSLLFLMFIAGRGIYIWVANFIFTIYLSYSVCKDAGCGKQKVVEGKRRASAPTFREAVRCPNCNPTPAFHIEKSDLDQPGAYENRGGAGDYPPHSAFSRWPQLTPENRAALANRPVSFPYAAGSSYPPPPQGPAPKLPPNVAQRHRLANGAAAPGSPGPSRAPRPGSLEEAIKTVRPLRSVQRGAIPRQPEFDA